MEFAEPDKLFTTVGICKQDPSIRIQIRLFTREQLPVNKYQLNSLPLVVGNTDPNTPPVQ